MGSHQTVRIRNVALVGHAGVGKTTLGDALIEVAGAIARRGSVDDGTSILDADTTEAERRGSVSLAVASFDWTTDDGTSYRINLLDTPGHPDFTAEADAAIAVADLAVVVVSATDGLEVGTELAWAKCVERGLPRLVFVTREDKPRADFEGILGELTEAFGAGIAPIELPIGEAGTFHGVADVLTETGHEYDADGTHHLEPIPAELADHEHQVHDRVVEEIVAGDDTQLERYLDGEEVTPAELERTLATEVRSGVEFPVLVGSGATGVGVDRLAHYICALGPSPADREFTVVAGGDRVALTADADAAPLLYVFKTISDQYVGQVSLFRVMTGTLVPDTVLTEVATGAQERLHSLFHVRGNERTPTDRLCAGDIGAVTKLATTVTGATLAPDGSPVTIEPAPLPAAHLAVALVPHTQSDDDRLPEALQRLVREDPALRVDHDPLSRRAILRAVGDAHLAVALARLERSFGVAVDTEAVRIPYRRTITRTAESQGRVKKQSGGHGQFAVVDLRVSPLPRGDGFEFVDAIFGGAIPKHYVAAVEHGIEEAMATGGAGGDGIGMPVVDVRVECYDGRTHSVDSSDMAFKTAAMQGFFEAVAAAGPVVLEPIVTIEVRVPVEMQGDVLGDLSARRGKVVASGTSGPTQVIAAEVPLGELARYTMDLRAMTAGRGVHSVGATTYDMLPDHLVAEALGQYEH